MKTKKTTGVRIKSSSEEIAEEQEAAQAETEIGLDPELIYSDNFVLLSDAFAPQFVKGIELPKILFKKIREDEQVFSERSVLMIYLNNTSAAIKAGLHKQLFKATKKGPIKLELRWVEETKDGKNTEETSIWKFTGARIQGIDFGTAIYKRPDINSVAIEVSYENLEIDGISF